MDTNTTTNSGCINKTRIHHIIQTTNKQDYNIHQVMLRHNNVFKGGVLKWINILI